ncbi:MAG: hypothetical protein ACTHNN_12770 [Xanthobacteraceae bacterium]
MDSTNRPGALESDRAGKIVLSGTLPHTKPTAQSQHRENADDYHRVVAVLNNRWRVIDCRDGIQWILQRRAGERHGRPRWDSWRYHRSRDALIASTGSLCGDIDPTAVAVLASLPPMIGPDNDAVRWIARRCQVSMATARTIAEHAGIGGRCHQ